jgi:hypothetical protein
MQTNNLSLVPASVILSPNDSVNNLNLLDFSNVGSQISADSMAFKKIQNFSKLNSQYIFSSSNSYFSKFNKINNLYLNESAIDNINPSVSIFRQHNYTSLKTSLNMFSTLVDTTSFKKFFNYTTSLNKESLNDFNVNLGVNNSYQPSRVFNLTNQGILTSILPYNSHFFNKISFYKFLNLTNFTSANEHFFNKNTSSLNNLSVTQPLNSIINFSKVNFKSHDFNALVSPKTELPNLYSKSINSFKVLNLKSNGQSIAAQEKSSRDLNKTNPDLSFQNNANLISKTLFTANNLQNTPSTNSNIYSSTNLG